MIAMTSNYVLNNVLTYRDLRLRGWRFVRGWFSFVLACGVGAYSAAIFFPFHLAWLGLYDRAELQAGETVLIHAAAGGAGSAAGGVNAWPDTSTAVSSAAGSLGVHGMRNATWPSGRTSTAPRWPSEPTTRKRSSRSACALTRPRPRRLSSTTGPWDALRKWMETGRSRRSRPALLPPSSGCGVSAAGRRVCA